MSLLASLVMFSGTPVTMNFKADPPIWDAILQNEGAQVTIVYEGDLNVAGVSVQREWTFGDLHIVYAYAEADALKKLVNLDNVLRISSWKKIGLPPFDYVVKNEGVTYDFSEDYKRIYHNANQRWTGKGVTVAIIDTGIDYLHPDFYRDNRTIIKALVSTIYRDANDAPVVYVTEGFTRAQMEEVLAYELRIKNMTNSEHYVFEDAVGHGTHVAGIVAGQGTASSGKYMGIAPGANLVIIKAFFDTEGGWATEETILDALQWVYDHAEEYNIRILSCSWGSPPLSPMPNPTEFAMRKLIEDKGIIVFSAAGNAGALPSTIISPARDPYEFAVGAIDPYARKLALFSSIGDPVPPPFNPQERTKPDFVGAGVNIIAPASGFANLPEYAIIHGRGGDYVIMSGTSMATPAVAATYATFYQYFIEECGRPPSKDTFIQFTRNHGHVYDPVGKDYLTGWGAPVVPAPS